MSVVSGAKGETAQQARSLVGLSLAALPPCSATAFSPIGDTAVLIGKGGKTEEYHSNLC
jgi:hypothetical protein